MKKLILAILIIILLSVGAIIIFSKFFSNQPEKQPPPENGEATIPNGQQTANIGDWATYRNTELGFEMKHPHGWLNLERDQIVHGKLFRSPDGKISTYLFGLQNPESIPLKEFAEVKSVATLNPQHTAYLDTPYLTRVTKEVLVANRPAIQVILRWASTTPPDFPRLPVPYSGFTPWLAGKHEESVFVSHNGEIYQIQTNFQETDADAYRPIWNTIISTFRFIDSQ